MQLRSLQHMGHAAAARLAAACRPIRGEARSGVCEATRSGVAVVIEFGRRRREILVHRGRGSRFVVRPQGRAGRLARRTGRGFKGFGGQQGSALGGCGGQGHGRQAVKPRKRGEKVKKPPGAPGGFLWG